MEDPGGSTSTEPALPTRVESTATRPDSIPFDSTRLASGCERASDLDTPRRVAAREEGTVGFGRPSTAKEDREASKAGEPERDGRTVGMREAVDGGEGRLESRIAELARRTKRICGSSRLSTHTAMPTRAHTAPVHPCARMCTPLQKSRVQSTEEARILLFLRVRLSRYPSPLSLFYLVTVPFLLPSASRVYRGE